MTHTRHSQVGHGGLIIRAKRGRDRDSTFVEFPESACVLLNVDEDRIVLVEQYRRAHNRITLELPGGERRAEESARECALRELREETGYRCKSLKHLLTLDLDFSVSRHKTHVFRATTKSSREIRTAQLKIVLCSISRALRYVLSGKITHAPTVAGILLFSLTDARAE